MGNNDKYFGGSRKQRKKISGSREHELKTFLGTRGFINGEQGIKSKKIKGSREHEPPPWEGLTRDSMGSKIRFCAEFVILEVKHLSVVKCREFFC